MEKYIDEKVLVKKVFPATKLVWSPFDERNKSNTFDISNKQLPVVMTCTNWKFELYIKQEEESIIYHLNKHLKFAKVFQGKILGSFSNKKQMSYWLSTERKLKAGN